MPGHQNLFVLDVDTDQQALTVSLRLSDRHGAHLGAHQVRLRDHDQSLWEGLFDTRSHVQRYEGSLRLDGRDAPATAEELLARLGVFLGREVLGKAITATLSRGAHQRTLLVRLPARADDKLAAAFARVPWEIARPAPGEPSLMARSVVVRAVTQGTRAGDEEVAVQPVDGKPLRVLLVFAAAPGSRPLALRLERERLLDMFFTARCCPTTGSRWRCSATA